MKKRRFLVALVVLVAVFGLSGCDLFPPAEEPETEPVPTPVPDPGIIAEANLVPATYIALRFAMPGQVAEIAVTEGEEVDEGQLLASLGNVEALEAQRLAANLAVMEAEQQLKELERFRADQDALDLAEAALNLARGQRRAALQALEDMKLTAPFAGKVMRIELKEGAYTSPSEMAILLADTSTWYLETVDLNEIEVVRISRGAQVEILFDALPDQRFNGEVESISEYFLERFGNITYVVRIRLAESSELLRWGMTAEVKFPE